MIEPCHENSKKNFQNYILPVPQKSLTPESKVNGLPMSLTFYSECR